MPGCARICCTALHRVYTVREYKYIGTGTHSVVQYCVWGGGGHKTSPVPRVKRRHVLQLCTERGAQGVLIVV